MSLLDFPRRCASLKLTKKTQEPKQVQASAERPTATGGSWRNLQLVWVVLQVATISCFSPDVCSENQVCLFLYFNGKLSGLAKT